MRTAVAALARHGIPLAANQVQYSLRHRKPETDGVLDACWQLDVALVAYRPIGGGSIATGTPGSSGRDGLAGVLEEVARGRGASVGQVALAWLLRRDERVVVIPGATQAPHVRENAGALALDLGDDEFAAIDGASAPGR
jgi:aryl-alcohol dehydrogenase-like predicted oxidoreductase